MFFLECFWHICFWPRRGVLDGLEKKNLPQVSSEIPWLPCPSVDGKGAPTPPLPSKKIQQCDTALMVLMCLQTHHSQNDASSSMYPIEYVMPCLFLSFSRGLRLSKRREKERQKYKMKEQNINRECVMKGSCCTFTLCCTFLLRSSSNVQQMSGRLRN